jgi:hypothetical protein
MWRVKDHTCVCYASLMLCAAGVNELLVKDVRRRRVRAAHRGELFKCMSRVFAMPPFCCVLCAAGVNELLVEDIRR